MSSGILCSMMPVLASCMISPESVKRMSRSCASATNSAGVMKGPSGAKVSVDFQTSQSEP